MSHIIAKTENLFKNHWYAITLGILCFPFFCFVLGSLGFFVKIPLTKWHGVAAILLTAGVVKYISPSWKIFAGRFGGVLGILLACILFSSFSIDRLWDGRSYHKPATFFLADGWNPFWQENLHEYTAENNIPWWEHLTHVHHFPKALWISSAITYLMTGNVHAGDYINPALMLAVFAVSLYAFRFWLSLRKWEALLAAALVALNPISIANLHSGYVDGPLGSALVIFLLAGTLWLKTAESRWIPTLLITAIYGCNLKHTAIPYFGMAGVVYSLAVLWNGRNNRHGDGVHTENRPSLSIASWFSVMFGILFSVLLLGFHPYITNTLEYTSPFYPLHTLDQENSPVEDIMSSCYHSEDFSTASPVQRFVYSHITGQPVPLKNCDYFTTTVSRIGNFPWSSDSFRNGFTSSDLNGFSWIFGLCLGLSFPALFFVRGKDRWLLLAAIGITILIQPHSWCARFVPQLWLFPILVFAFIRADVYALPWLERRTRWLFGILSFALLAFCFARLYDVCSATLYEMQFDRQAEEFIREHPGGVIITCLPQDDGSFLPPKLLFHNFEYYSRRTMQDIGVEVKVFSQCDNNRLDHLAKRGQWFYRYQLYCLPDALPEKKTVDRLSLHMAGSMKSKIPASLYQTAKLRLRQLKNAWLGE